MTALSDVISAIDPIDRGAIEKALILQNRLAKPPGSLGRLEELSARLSGIKFSRIEHKAIIVMAADHGVTAQGVSAYPKEVTARMVETFLEEGGGVNVLARLVGARLVLVDIGVASKIAPNPRLVSRKIAYGTNDMTLGPAMTRKEAVRSIETGIDVLEEELPKGLDIVGTGDMGIGNTTPSSAICSAITGKPVAEVTGMGTGVGEKGLHHKVEVIERALKTNDPDPNDPLDVLAKVGGFEIGGLTGVILGAAAHKIPAVIDGFVSGAAALLAVAISPLAREYIVASHLSAENGHRAMLEHLGLKPLLDLEMRLGEGTGSALGIFLAEAASETLWGMKTFDEMMGLR